MGAGPIVVGFDGSPESENVLREALPVLVPSPVLVVVVWEPALVFDLVPPSLTAAPTDVRVALELEEVLMEAAQRMAEHGADLARQMGREAEGLAVADEVSVADTLIRVASDKDAPAIVVGTSGVGGIKEVLLGSTARDVVRRAHCPVVLYRSPRPGKDQERRPARGER